MPGEARANGVDLVTQGTTFVVVSYATSRELAAFQTVERCESYQLRKLI